MTPPQFRTPLRRLLGTVRSDVRFITRRIAGTSSPPELVRNWLPTLAVVGVALSVLQFWNTNIYEPSARPPYVIMTATMKTVGEHNSFVALKGSINVHNKSKVKVHIFATWYNVFGIKNEMYNDLKDINTYVDSMNKIYDDSVVFNLNSQPSESNVLAFGRLLEGWVLYPDEEGSSEFVVYVPSNKYDHVEIAVSSYIYIYRDDFLKQIIRKTWIKEKTLTSSEKLGLNIEINETIHPLVRFMPRYVAFDPGTNNRHKAAATRYGLIGSATRSMLSLWKAPGS